LCGAAHGQLDALDQICVQHVENRIGGQHVENAARGIKVERLLLAQGQQAGNVIDVCVGQHDCLDGGVAQRTVRVRLQHVVSGDLFADVGGGIKQDPIRAIGRGSNGRLGARLQTGFA
jgi:hypothetical protein